MFYIVHLYVHNNVLGGIETWDLITESKPVQSITVNLDEISPSGTGSGIWVFGYGGSPTNPNRQALYYASLNSQTWQVIGPDIYERSYYISSMSLSETSILTINFTAGQWTKVYLGFRKL